MQCLIEDLLFDKEQPAFITLDCKIGLFFQNTGPAAAVNRLIKPNGKFIQIFSRILILILILILIIEIMSVAGNQSGT